jgi:L-threonylcarbamoyladenylate synthase
MNTLLTLSPIDAAEIVKRGGIVAFPTETVYGLGANVFDETAIAKIFEAKRRPADNPLIAHVSEIGQINELTAQIPSFAHLFIRSFFPGPLTVVLLRSDKVPLIATAGLDSIGVRMPRFELAHRFIQACGVPVVAPSANLSGKPSPTTWQAVLEDLDGRIDCILQGDPTEIGLESTVVDCTSDIPMILRQGAVSLSELRTVVPETVEYTPVEDELPRSPGLRHRHYSPRAKIVLYQPAGQIVDVEDVAYIGIRPSPSPFLFSRQCKDVAGYAHSVFEFFRECDRHGIETIYCEVVPEIGIGAALMDRLRRAAEK